MISDADLAKRVSMARPVGGRFVYAVNFTVDGVLYERQVGANNLSEARMLTLEYALRALFGNKISIVSVERTPTTGRWSKFHVEGILLAAGYDPSIAYDVAQSAGVEDLLRRVFYTPEELVSTATRIADRMVDANTETRTL